MPAPWRARATPASPDAGSGAALTPMAKKLALMLAGVLVALVAAELLVRGAAVVLAGASVLAVLKLFLGR